MRYTCTLNALEAIEQLRHEARHLWHDGLSDFRYRLIVESISTIERSIRGEYARLHPNEAMPASTHVPQSATDAEAPPSPQERGDRRNPANDA